MNINELRSQLAAKKKELREMLTTATDEKRALSVEENTAFQKVKNDAEALKSTIEAAEQLEAEEVRNLDGNKETATAKHTDKELRNWVKTGEIRSLDTQTDGGAAETVIPEIDKTIGRLVLDQSPIRQLASSDTTSSNAKKKLLTRTPAQVKAITEGAVRTETGTPEYLVRTYTLGQKYAYPKVTNELLDHSGFDIEGWLSGSVADEFAQQEQHDFTHGDGVNGAKGYLSYSQVDKADDALGENEVQAITATGDLAADLITTFFSLKAGYRKNSTWVMSSEHAKALVDLKDADGNYMFKQALTDGVADKLLGRPVQYDELADQISIADWKRAYVIVGSTTGTKMFPDQITEPGFKKVHSYRYLSGGIYDNKAIKVLGLVA